MNKKLWIDGVFSLDILKECLNYNIEGIILSLDPLDDFFLPLEQCLKIMEVASSKLVKIKVKIYNTSFESIQILINKLSIYNFEIVLTDVKILDGVLSLKVPCYLSTNSSDIPYIKHSYFLGYIFEDADKIIESNDYQIGVVCQKDLSITIQSNFQILTLRNYQNGYRQIDSSSLEQDLKRALKK